MGGFGLSAMLLAPFAAALLSSPALVTAASTPAPEALEPPEDGKGWQCGPSICCLTEPPWLSGWFMQNVPTGDRCQLELQPWGYTLVAGAAFLLSSLLCLTCYATRRRKCWDPCRPCCMPWCMPDFQSPKVTDSHPAKHPKDPIASSAGWAAIVPKSAHEAVPPDMTGPLVPDYFPVDPYSAEPVYDFNTYISALAPDTAASITRHRLLQQYNAEALQLGRTRQVASTIGRDAMQPRSLSEDSV